MRERTVETMSTRPAVGKAAVGFAPARYILIAYGGLILLGTFLLSLPQASAMDRPLSVIEALFTAASAVCVTGLTVVSTAHDLTLVGQIIVLALLQVGALGIMTISTFFVLLLGRRVRLQDRLFLQQDLNHGLLSGLVRLVRQVVLVALTLEAVGAVMLYLALPGEYSLGRRVYFAVFHSVSAFANGGFDLFGDSLESLPTRLAFGTIVMVLALFGGLGFTVIQELRSLGKGRRFSLYTRVALRAALLLLLSGALLVFILERNNPETLEQMNVLEQLWHALFLSAMTRSGGFSTLPTSGLGEATLFLCMLLMFIGTSPGSTGGGIKTTTAAIIWAGVRSSLKGRRNVTILNRRLPVDAVPRALTLVSLAGAVILGALFLLTLTEETPFLKTAFESVSAFGTVGLSTGVSASFSDAARLVFVFLMLIGRVGPVTFALALRRNDDDGGERVRLPEERLPLG